MVLGDDDAMGAIADRKAVGKMCPSTTSEVVTKPESLRLALRSATVYSKEKGVIVASINKREQSDSTSQFIWVCEQPCRPTS
jgi:hypothetical protein